VMQVLHPGLGTPPQPEHLLACFAEALAAEAAPMLCLLPAGLLGEELAARLAFRLGGVPLGRCTALAIDGAGVTARRATHGGRAEAVLTTEAPLCFAAMRRPAAAPAPVAAPALREMHLATALPAGPPPPEPLPASGPPQRRLEGARVVVSGGRGIGGPEGFALLQDLAALLDGVAGASLPAVDAGWAAVAQQVGQSGAFVTPELYLAFAMSGTPQHLAGIGLNSRIVAVNADAEAEIFRVAELGLVAPWQEVLPRLIDRLRQP
jgi:electron transfer flavoprotein alpha subunit